MARRRTEEDEFRYGTRIFTAELPEGYTPPSASMNPAATVTPMPGTASDADDEQLNP
jgi:hypothetical protein